MHIPASALKTISVGEKFEQLTERWRPKSLVRLNGQEIKIVKVKGAFPWHHHELEDELFFVWRGRIRIEFRDHEAELEPGDMLVVPRGVEHRPVAKEEAEMLLFEPIGVRNTGNIVDPHYTAPQCKAEDE